MKAAREILDTPRIFPSPPTLRGLEAGKQLNPTLETLVLYAQAIGKRLCVVLAPAAGAPGAALPKTLAHVAQLIADAMAKHEVDAK